MVYKEGHALFFKNFEYGAEPSAEPGAKYYFISLSR